MIASAVLIARIRFPMAKGEEEIAVVRKHINFSARRHEGKMSTASSLACLTFGSIMETRASQGVQIWGIAQLVERVVRNDEAWGSNPHTSSLRSQGSAKRRLSRRSLSEGGPFEPNYVASYDSACQARKCDASHTFTCCRARPIKTGFTPGAPVILRYSPTMAT